MKKIAIVLVSMFALTGCIERADNQDQTADMMKVQGSLPEGCTLHYAGRVRVEGTIEKHPSRIFFTVCGNAVTTSETHSVQQGKTTVDQNDVSVVTN
jgi:hypothetical protein